MDIKFCDECDNFMNFVINEENKPLYQCSRCMNQAPYDYKTDKKIIKFDATIQKKEIIKNNKNFILDPTLPVLTNIKCTNSDCKSNTNKNIESKVNYLKYDYNNINFMYICTHCGQKWTNNL